ncbi:MAG TPA: hypothetical protein H9829_02005 [Candidatus Tetragenococcus pullicola]|nr:hypothetical protein [Candidatus Tetragenococcus pullicola]
MNKNLSMDDIMTETYELTGGILGLYLFIDDRFVGTEGITLEDISALNGLSHAILEISKKHDRHIEEFSQIYRESCLEFEEKDSE